MASNKGSEEFFDNVISFEGTIPSIVKWEF
jgi:hypothetical protein